MTLTPVFLTGFEHGLLSTNGAGLLDWVTPTTVTLDASNQRNGSYCAKVAAPGGATCQLQKNITGTKAVERFAVRVAVRPSAGNFGIVGAIYTTPDVTGAHLRVDSAGQLSLRLGSGNPWIAGPTIDTTGYHLIELQQRAP